MRFTVLILVLFLIPIAPIAGAPQQATHRDAAANALVAGSVPKVINTSRTGLLPNQAVNVYLGYSKEPAPMGIADYGIGPSGPYQYSTNQSKGVADIVSLSTRNSTGSKEMTIQLNAVLQFTSHNSVHVYWVQDVADIVTSNNLVQFVDNIWNESSPTASMQRSAVSGSGTTAASGRISFYYDAAGSLPGNDIALTLPVVVQFQLVASLDSSNRPVIQFMFDDGHGMQTYDTVTFLTSGKVTMPGFTVNGSKFNPFGSYYDSELILGGSGDSQSTSDVSSDVRLELLYYNNHNFQSVPNAYNFGSNTAEIIGNTLSQSFYSPANGELLSRIQAGAGTLGSLYNSTQLGEIVYTSSSASGILEIQNSTYLSPTPSQYQFTGGQAMVTVQPGTYSLLFSENGIVTKLGSYAVGAGQVIQVPSQSGTAQVTLSYSVLGGGSGYSPPQLTFTQNGTQQTVALTTTATSYKIDVGSFWNVSSTLQGSSGNERWSTNQPSTGTAGSAQTFQFAFHHQFLTTVSYSLTGGGSPAAPGLTYFSFGGLASSSLSTSAQTLWADSGSPYSVPVQLTGSGANERWSTTTASGTIQASSSVLFPYYHQYLKATGYNVVGGGSNPGSPSVQCTQYGIQIGEPLGSPTWDDAGSSCAFSQVLSGSTQNTRWATPSPNVLVSGPGVVALTYYHQYPLLITLGIVDGASPSSPTITAIFFGTSSAAALATGSVTEWLDAGSPYVVSNPLPSSTASERWSSPDATSGVLNGPATASITFYHQLMLSAALAVSGGGSPISPFFSYVNFRSPASFQLSGSPQSVWADAGTRYSTASRLNGTTSTERWSTSSSTGAVKVPGTLTFTYYHQWLLTITGASLSSRWFNSSSTATLTVSEVFGRSSGSGQRIASYILDAAVPTTVKPSLGNLTISVMMNAAHSLSITSVNQYQVSIDAAAATALSSITPSTIHGDSYWYDQGTPVQLLLNGIWSRSSGSGDRLTSYTVDGSSKTDSTSGQTEVLNIASISSPHTVTATIAAQYQITTTSGSLSSITSPQIPGDAGWYDSGTSVVAAYEYSWNPSATQSRSNAIGYTVDKGSPVPLERTSAGVFQVQVTMSAPHSISVQSVTQYSLTVSGGSDVTVSAISPTGDAFYDSGSSITATTDYTWDIVNANTQQNLISYGIDGQVSNVTRAASGSFTTPAISFNSAHQLIFSSVTRFLISLRFQDGLGTTTIQPTSVEIQVNDPTLVNLNGSQIWLDNGTKFQVHSVVWEGSDVTPTSPVVLTARGPNLETIPVRVYDARLTATDYLGFPVSGATVTAALANGTTIQTKTSSSGVANLGLIPIGTYDAKVSYLGVTSSIAGDASAQSSTTVKVLASYPSFALLSVWIVVGVLVAALLVRRRKKEKVYVVDFGLDELRDSSTSGSTG